jgi:colicin import membrane protein
VGLKLPNAFGLFDMNGNVWEWTQDCYRDNYVGAPTDGSARDCSGSYRVLRGGSWNFAPASLRSASRFEFNPVYKDSGYGFGFRLARDLFNAEAGSIAEQDSKQAADPQPATDEGAAEAAARKQKDKEVAARLERARQQKEQEDRISKMAKQSEIKDQTEAAKKRILKDAYVDITALDTAFNLVAKVSDKYAASIQAAIRPNITFDPDSIAGNPAVEIQIGLKPDGTIMNASIVKTSGIRSWDAAATRAVEKTERLPKDESGRAPSTLVLVLRPRER